MAHANARLTEFGRLRLVQRITELGWPPAAPGPITARMGCRPPRSAACCARVDVTAKAHIASIQPSGRHFRRLAGPDQCPPAISASCQARARGGR
jgi:hypothetical protein